jgi:hypothetical protein
MVEILQFLKRCVFATIRGFVAPGATLASYLLPLSFLEMCGIRNSFLEMGRI